MTLLRMSVCSNINLQGAECRCPKCGSEFKVDYESDIEESGDFPEFYDKCLRQKVTWE